MSEQQYLWVIAQVEGLVRHLYRDQGNALPSFLGINNTVLITRV